MKFLLIKLNINNIKFFYYYLKLYNHDIKYNIKYKFNH